MKPSRLLLVCGLFFSTACAAGNYTLSQGTVAFSTPDTWNAIMQKTEGDPQFFAFQVPNPDAPQTLTRVSVNTRHIGGRAAFRAYVNKALVDALASAAYKALDGNDPEAFSLRYSADEDGQRQVYREDYFYRRGTVVTLRCVRPQNAPAHQAWLAAYKKACATIAAQLAH